MNRFLSLLLLATFLGCTHTLPVEQDAPDEAFGYYAMKRAGTDDPQRAYDVARERMARMERYSTADDAVVPSYRALAAGDTEPVFHGWTFLGPGNIGGRTRVLVVNPDDPNILYSGAVSGGVWKTTNGGLRWEPMGDVLANLTVNSLVMSPVDHNVLFAGTGEGYFREEVRGTALPLRGNGIFVTRDGGLHWQQLAATKGEDFLWVNDLVISAHDPHRLYAATRTGVLRSDDEGATWSHVLPVTVKGGCLDLAYRADTSGDYLFASCGTLDQATVYRNEHAEGSGGWTSVLSETNMARTTLAIAPSNPSVVYALSATNQSGINNQALLAVFRSDANGDPGSWHAQVRNEPSSDKLSTLLLTNATPAVQDQCFNGAHASVVTMGWYCNTIAVDPVNPDRVFAGGVDLFRSDDGGKTWGLASYWWAGTNVPSFAHADQHSITFHPGYNGTTNRTLWLTNDGGVYRTDNATATVRLGLQGACDPASSKVTFVSLNHNYGATQFYHGAVAPDGQTWMGGAQDNSTLVGTNATGIDAWQVKIGGDGGYCQIDPIDPRTMYGESQGANIQKTVDSGAHFQTVTHGLSGTFLFVTPLMMDPNTPSRLWTGGNRIFRTDDGANLWIPAGAPADGLVSAIAVAPGNSDLVLVGTSTGRILRNEHATQATFDTAWADTKPRDGFVSSIGFDPNDRTVVYATYAGFGGTHVWQSTDSGATWHPLDGSGDGALPDMPVHSIAVDPTRATRLYLGTDLGVFASTDGGQTWRVENDGFAAVVTEWVTIGKGTRGPAVYAFTHGRGAWRAELVSALPKRRSTR